MTELTKEFFEQQLKTLATKDGLQSALDSQTKELKTYVHSAFETQQEYIEARFDEIKADLDLPARLRAIEKRLDKLEAQRAR